MKHFTKCLKFLWLALCFVGGVGSAWADTTYKLEQVTSVTAGEMYVFEQDGYVMNNTVSNSALQTTDSYKSLGLAGTETYIWKLEIGTNGFKIKNIALNATTTNVYIANTSSTGISFSSSASVWAFNFQEDGTVIIQNKSNSDRFLGYTSTSSYAYKAYATSNLSNSSYPHAIKVYKLVEEVAPSYTISATSSNDSYGTVSITNNVITATPAEGYRVSTSSPYTVTDGEATVSQNGNVFTITADADCTIRINFEALPTYTATFYVNGSVESGPTSYEVGENIVFPTNPENIEDKTFVGWIANAIDGVIDEEPEMIYSTVMGEANVTYYAVFASSSSGEGNVSTTVTANTTNVPDAYGTANAFNDYTLNGVTYAIQQMYKNGGKLQWRAGGNSNGTGTMYNVDAINKIQSIVLAYDGSDSNRNFTVKVGDSANPTSGTSITPTSSNNVYTFDCSDNNCNYFVLANGSGAGYLESLTITYKGEATVYSGFCTTVAADARSEAGISFAEATVTKEIVANYTGQVLTNPNSLAVTWTSSDEAVATVENGVVTMLAVGETTITATFAGNEDYKAGSASYVLTVQDSREAITLSFAEASVNVNVDESVDAPTLNGNTGSGAVTYTSSDEAIATVNPSTGEVTGVADGTVTITATVAATNEYQGGTATFTVNVIDPNKKGSATNPYTVAEALDATPASGNSETVYVSGIVSRFYNTDIVTDNSHRYYISDDGTTETDELMVYNGKGLNNVAFSSADDLQIGDKVVIVGQLTTYNSTKEFAKDNYIYSRTTKLDNIITVTGGTEFTIDRTQDEEELTFTATATSGTTVTFTIDTENTTIAAADYLFEDGTLLVSGNKGGVIVIKANAAGNEDYKDAEEVTITVTVVGVKADATILVEDSEIAYGETFTVDDSAIEGGAITVTSSNTAVATVDGLVITPVAVGTTTITVATAEDETYKAGSETFTLTVTAPAGLATAKPGNFVKVTSDEDLTDGQYLIVYEDGGLAFDGSLETLDAVGNTIAVEITDGVIAATEATEAAVFTYNATAKTLMSASGFYIGQTSDANGLASSDETAYTNAISFDGEGNVDIASSGGAYLRYNSASNQARFRYYKTASYTNQKAIQLYKQSGTGNVSVTFNSYGYATLCSPYPLDFTNAPGVDAYIVSEANGTQVNFKDFDCPVKGGTPLFLVGKPGSTVTIPSVDSENVPDVNQLVGTLAPTYVETENGAYTNFGLSGENFVKINSGTVKAGKAYLPVLTETLPAQGAKLRLVFTDSATGIATVKEVPAAALDGILYNLGGQRVNASYKGIVIKDGKKYLNK